MIDVAIVGCGPTGALLGNLLGARGLQVSIFEKQPDLFSLPRAVHFDGEAMRLFQSVGLAESLLPLIHVNPGMLFKDVNGKTLVDWSRDMTVGPMGWHESYRFHQPDLELLLRAGLKRYPHVELRSATAVEGLTQQDDHVAVKTEVGEMQAKYVVACDGADSSVRRLIGANTEDLGFQERWLVVDVILQRERPDLGDYSVQFCDAQAPATYVRGVGERRRWECRLSESDPDSFKASEIWKKLSRWITPEDSVLERSAVYTFRSQIADHWQVDRVFLAGDAAHQMPPFMGQGMGAGLRDAGNLAWKIAAVCNGADPAILETFESERKPNARAFINLSVELGLLINRTAAGQKADKKMNSIWPSLGPGLGTSGDIVGRLVPQAERADDAAPSGFYALVRKPIGTQLPETIGNASWLRKRKAFGVIVRPDGYALASAVNKANFIKEIERYLPLIQTLPLRRL